MNLEQEFRNDCLPVIYYFIESVSAGPDESFVIKYNRTKTNDNTITSTNTDVHQISNAINFFLSVPDKPNR